MDSKAEKLARVASLEKQMEMCDKYRSLLSKIGRDRTAKFDELGKLKIELEKQSNQLIYEAYGPDIEAFLSNVGGIRVSE